MTGKYKGIGRRGIFFSLIAMLLAGLTISSFLVYNKYKYSDQMDIIGTRVVTMNDFLNSIDDDLNRALYIASFRALITMDDYITNVNKSGGRLLNNSASSFKQLMNNGTMENRSEEEPLMIDQTMPDWMKKIENISLKIGINTTINMSYISIYHTSPWKVGIKANFSITMDDEKEVAHWDKVISTETDVEIIGFQDPLYANRTGGVYRKIEQIDITKWNVSNLMLFLESGKYTAKSSSPTFLMRMEGNMSGNPNGILTLVDEDDVLETYNRSSVDFIYWGTQANSNQKIHDITDDGYENFRLDPEHIEHFNASDYNYTGP